ncbi:hypothetical protein COOONC_21449, partial [Cooperia oncophora]
MRGSKQEERRFLIVWINMDATVSLIFLGAMIALSLLQFIPKWTCWLLVVVIAIWDVIAVLTPCLLNSSSVKGPLRMLVELAEKRDKDIMPAMIY